ncbi:hypothetical protein PGAG_00312 [Phaeocystis globosa virus 12T]|uniref:Uncharacterized protein n=1 Tax=Phaeocystis globosa virus PgV-16T TaxID=3071227 RepID=A0AC59EXJ4_9VIRU|nr:hypothetical protein PGCG_00351 [Phaeocystis globosa virus]AET73201.1 hypothetical protein PGAG_00312 [Phaeocystis globosa virus 12T]AET74025.1 hypothetical protein PGBG_00317 [Phaeocystis globosa virus 14T]AGM15662.1 hypothetical protein PGCG_00351 [Phaeocystis globosa virus PgV-16T]UYE94392.1 hypothetical protein PGV14T_00351 [Phaeocystis globosa virus]
MLDPKKIDLPVLLLSYYNQNGIRNTNYTNLIMMTNLFDNLPEDIQNKIHIMRLDSVVNKITQKKTKATADMMNDIMGMLDNHPAKNLAHGNIHGTQEGQIYYNPFNADTYSIMSMAWHLLKDHKVVLTQHERFSWIMFLLRPVELGLIVLENTEETTPFFEKTSLLCADMINTFGCRSLRSVVA